MRTIFADTLIKIAEKNPRICLLTGDLGFSILEKFQRRFPDRFFNMGVAEQNMIGVAAGLAMEGKIVFVYSISPFITMRCLEQVRNDICFQNLKVRLIGVGAGVSYGTAGNTHYALEDIAVMRSLVNMTVMAPGDIKETEAVIKTSIEHNGPVYIRLGKDETSVHSSLANFKIGQGIVVNKGTDAVIIAAGTMLHTAKKVGEMLKDKGFSVSVVSMPTIKPLDKKLIKKLILKVKAIFTVEEHSVIGGLGSAVAEVIADSGKKILFKKFALPDKYICDYGSREYILKKNGLLPQQVLKKTLFFLQRRRICKN